MSTTEITREQKLTIVKHLANGKGLDVTATIARLPLEAVDHIGQEYGYPDRQKLGWAVDALTEEIESSRRDLPPGTQTSPARTGATRPAPATPRPAPASTTAPARIEQTPASTGKPDEFRVLINTAKNHDKVRIQRLAETILDDCARLRGLIDAEAEAYAERQRIKQQKAQARAEIDRLERQLAEAKARLRGATPATAQPVNNTGDEVPAREVRAWAAEHDIDCPGSGRVPAAVRQAYDEAHSDAA